MNKKDYKITLLNVGILEKENVINSVYDTLEDEEKYEDGGYYYKINKSELSPEEINTMLLAKVTDYTRIIKNICIFFAIIAIISIVLTIISFLKISDFMSNIKLYL